ncbi:MAG: efflux RND transporter periplasmic adaptor subunit [Deltaproteobacteria bacterium]|nr:efflux RND transporter periplasmic adaptor subunit [Candidatus Zymogenaceae bacterium]
MADKKKIVIPIVLLAAAVGVTIVVLVGNHDDDGAVRASGTIEATEVDISSRLSGVIVDIPVDEGDRVAEGDLLATIRAAELEASRIGAQALFDEAETNLSRIRNLYAAGGVSRMDLDSAESAYLQAKSALSTIDASLVDSTLYAPIDGVVLTKNMEEGETAFPGVALVTIADLTRVWIDIYVPEPMMGRVSLGDEARITVDSHPGRHFPGVVTNIADEPEFTPKNIQTEDERTKLVFAVTIELDNPDLALKPGMPADAEIILSDI